MLLLRTVGITAGKIYNWNTIMAEITAVWIRHADHVAPSIRKIWH
jgi:hypothetical protein